MPDCFWNVMCICKTSKVISTSGNLAAILDFWHTSTSHEIGSTTVRKLDPENISVAVEIMSLCALELEICLGVFLAPPPPLPVRHKNKKAQLSLTNQRDACEKFARFT